MKIKLKQSHGLSDGCSTKSPFIVIIIDGRHGGGPFFKKKVS